MTDRPGRIVSLVPSITELLFAIGVGDSLIGRTRFCEEPAGEVEPVEAVGGTKNPDCERIICLLYTSPSPRDKRQSRMPSSA